MARTLSSNDARKKEREKGTMWTLAKRDEEAEWSMLVFCLHQVTDQNTFWSLNPETNFLLKSFYWFDIRNPRDSMPHWILKISVNSLWEPCRMSNEAALATEATERAIHVTSNSSINWRDGTVYTSSFNSWPNLKLPQINLNGWVV